GEQRLDRLGKRLLGEPTLQGERQELLDEERIALGGLRDARMLVGLERRAAEPVQERERVLGREQVERDSIHTPRRLEERRMLLQQLFASKADDEDRRLALLGEVVDQLEEGRLRPVHVVEDQNERPVACERFAESAKEKGDLGRWWRRLRVQ